MAKKRLDQELVDRGLAASRERAKALILSGCVLVDDQPETKAGHPVKDGAVIRVRGADHPYVSRGALKLRGALDAFAIDVKGMICADVGASTGGFTEILLERGAPKVFAVDVGTNQLHWKIRSDPRVAVFEKCNARSLTAEVLGERVERVVVDVSFISLTKLVEGLLAISKPSARWVTLIKPQFEVGPDRVGKGGIVNDVSAREEAIETVTRAFEGHGIRRLGLIESPITGTDGNVEYLAAWEILQDKK